MRVFDSWWTSLVYVFDLATFSTWTDRHHPHQQALKATPTSGSLGDGPVFQPVHYPDAVDNIAAGPNDRIILPPYPPNDRPTPEESIFCNYTAMGSQWSACNTNKARDCWLKGPAGKQFNITTDYELSTPIGITRKYVLDVAAKALAPDGVPMAHGKVFNDSYPGPWIQACWGDTLEITVRNHLRFNGTTIHWHGIRQLNGTENDGVNGVTQCPIAPNHEMTYKFNATQYGSSWYHSHYSLQYADGLLGPLTIYGPSSVNYDYAVKPLLMTDWNHRSAFEDWSYSLQPGNGRPLMTNILLNGLGRYIDPQTNKPVVETERYEKVLIKSAKYLLRLINTSVDTTFVFTIDGHDFTVIEADFVPIHPYKTSSVVIGIGQRYHVVLTAIPTKPSVDGNYWIRTIPANGCGNGNFVNYTQLRNNTGIIRYNKTSDTDPTTSQNPKLPLNCTDEIAQPLEPKVNWTIGDPSNFDVKFNNTYDVGLQPIHGYPYQPDYDRSLWLIDNLPLWVSFGKPTILNLNTPNGSWPNYLDVVAHNQAANNWIYLVITAPDTPQVKDPARNFFPVAHPIHLHGHDFAILVQSSTAYPGWNNVQTQIKKRLINPPRRDVALLPASGYLIIAFKADNPGTWLLHCHIAWHASSGLALQILENTQNLSTRLTTDRVAGRVIQAGIVDTCNAWGDWVSDPRNHYDPHRPDAFQDDSGV